MTSEISATSWTESWSQMSSRDFCIKYTDAVELDDGSYIGSDGVITWYNEAGQYHREDGPAVILSDGDIVWYVYGVEYSFNEWCIEMNKTDETKLLLRLQYA